MEQKKTKIICTISDMNCEIDFIRQLYMNGMNVARINSAHATLEGAQRVVDNIRAVSDRIGILIDTKGPEVRLTAMENSVGFIAKANDMIDRVTVLFNRKINLVCIKLFILRIINQRHSRKFDHAFDK